MSHDLYASWATAEVVRLIKDNPYLLLDKQSSSSRIDIFANRESGRTWPIPDGRISAHVNNKDIEVAIELKRENEGVHGILTAIGQSQAYLHKGYHSSVIIIPESYNSLVAPGNYITNVINSINPSLPIGVFSYKEPNSSNPSPFKDRMHCHRNINVDLTKHVILEKLPKSSNTQWAHLREGSSEPDAFFRYLQTAKRISSQINNQDVNINHLPQPLIDAVCNLGKDPIIYLSYCRGDGLHDKIWMNFWYDFILTKEVSQIWNFSNNKYFVNNSPTKLFLDDYTPKTFFSGRSDSIKDLLVNKLNSHEISESDAWISFAEKIHNRAHSYREDIDSGLSHLGLLEDDGRPTELGYRYVDLCERFQDPNSEITKKLLGSVILKNGDYASFLHYIYRLSEEIFNKNPLAFTLNRNNKLIFDKNAYLQEIRNLLANNLNVLNTASIRGGSSRKPFQGEFAILSKLDIIGNISQRYRIGNGLIINWPKVQEYLDFSI